MIVIATIRALGKVASKAGYQELLNVKYMGYPAVVGREAEKALKSCNYSGINHKDKGI